MLEKPALSQGPGSGPPQWNSGIGKHSDSIHFLARTRQQSSCPKYIHLKASLLNPDASQGPGSGPLAEKKHGDAFFLVPLQGPYSRPLAHTKYRKVFLLNVSLRKDTSKSRKKDITQNPLVQLVPWQGPDSGPYLVNPFQGPEGDLFYKNFCSSLSSEVRRKLVWDPEEEL